jgi:hypothetical protein
MPRTRRERGLAWLHEETGQGPSNGGAADVDQPRDRASGRPGADGGARRVPAAGRAGRGARAALVTGRLTRTRALQRPARARGPAVRPHPAHRRAHRPRPAGCDGPARGVLLRDAVHLPRAAARLPPGRGGQARGGPALRGVGLGPAAALGARHGHRQAVLRPAVRPVVPRGRRRAAREVRDDLQHQARARPGHGRLDELHRARGPRAVAGPVLRRRRRGGVPPARAGVPPDGARPARARADAARPRSGSSPATRSCAGSGTSPAAARPAGRASTDGPCSGWRCTRGTASAASRWPARSRP